MQKFFCFRTFKTLKQIFQWESIPCVYLLDIWSRLLAKVCFIASFICLFPFVAFCANFDGLWPWTQLCGLLSPLPLKAANQSWHTGPNETVLHFQVVFVISWHQIGELVLVILWTVLLILHKLRKTWSKIRYVNTLKQTFQLKGLPCMFLYDIFNWLLAKVCLDASFICLSPFVAFRLTFYDLCCSTQRCGLLSHIYLWVRAKVGTLAQMNLYYTSKLWL